MNNAIGGCGDAADMFKTIGGWTTEFDINGKKVGGNVQLANDSRLLWHMDMVDGVMDKKILELGPLEGAHTKMMIEAGAKEVIAVEGLSDCFLRCLIVKEAFRLDNARFVFGDFCLYVEKYSGDKFDIVSAAGVLYHQKNPAKLIYDLARITDTVFVWSQVASEHSPSDRKGTVIAGGKEYRGKINNYGGTRLTLASYCGGLEDEAFWMYRSEMERCFKDAGFECIFENEDIISNENGDCVSFVAEK